MIKKYLIQFLPSIIIISLFFIFFYSPSNKEAKKQIKELNLLNKRLGKANDSILVQINKYESDLNKSDEIIKSLFEEDAKLKDKMININSQLTTLKSKYEKANNHSNDFNSIDIERYFSNL
jgi:predicted nuclease with TOPRIM domain